MDRLPNSWDVIVVGAGPAGSAAAITAARQGLRVLQVDAKPFPRRKVCGGCLIRASLDLLYDFIPADDLLWSASSPFSAFKLYHRQQQFEWPLPTGKAVDRLALDQRLVEVGQRTGVTFWSGVHAKLGPSKTTGRMVELRSQQRTQMISAKAVVIAGGLSNRCGEDFPKLTQVAADNSRIGMEAMIERPDNWIGKHSIHMAVAPMGYIGIAEINLADRQGTREQHLHLAAAVGRDALRQFGPHTTVLQILDRAGISLPITSDIGWRGTPALTARALRLSMERVFLVGDAAGYVEPFTGEGIRWALESGIGVVPWVAHAVHGWRPEFSTQWECWHRQNIGSQQRICRQIAFGLKHSPVRWLAHQVLCIQPRLAHTVIHRINRV